MGVPRVAAQVAATEPFLTAFNHIPPPGWPSASLRPSSARSSSTSSALAHQHVRLQVYPHHLESTASIVEWTKCTTLTRFTKVLTAELIDSFIDAYRERLLDTIGVVRRTSIRSNAS